MISRLGQKDYSALIQLWIDSGLEYRPNGRDSETEIKLQMEQFPDMFWGFWEDRKLVGSVIVSDDGRKGWINRIAVHPNYRRKGIAKLLIDHSEKMLRDKGIFIIAALIYRSNCSSLNLFKSAGYETLPEIVYLRHSLKEGI